MWAAGPARPGSLRRLKNGRSRTAPLIEELAERLRRREVSGTMMFAGPRGGRLTPDVVRRALIRDVLGPLADRSPAVAGGRGFRDGRLHSFRHYFCSRCANNGVPEMMLMTWLGHGDSQMVRHYYHLQDAEARERINAVGFLGRSPDVPATDRGPNIFTEETPGA